MDLFEKVLGQDDAVSQLRAAARQPVHAYLFVGPGGTGKRYASVAFAAALLCPNGGCGDCDVCLRVVAGAHPDLMVVEREGANISVEQAREISRVAMRTPMESNRQVIVLTDFHLVEEAAPALLKTIEEPSDATVFVIHAEYVPSDLQTIASRCVRVDFVGLKHELISETLKSEGVDEQRATEIARVSFGSMVRARSLAHDLSALARIEFWENIPSELNGTGSRVVDLSNQVTTLLDEAAESVEESQTNDKVEFIDRAKMIGSGATEKKDFEARQKRELRRARTDELRAGLLTLAYKYRDMAAVETEPAKREQALRSAVIVQTAEQRLLRNPNEVLMIDATLTQLDELAAV